MQDSHCNLCGRPIKLAKLDYSGELAPFDADPSSKGTFVLLEHTAFNVEQHPLRDLIGGPRYQEHAQTCPKLAEMEKAK